MARVKISIRGSKVQEIGYRIFLLEQALENDINRVYARNLDKDSMELLLDDDDEKINSFYRLISKKKPKGAVVKDLKMEPYSGSILIPPIEKYFQFLTLEQLSRGREEIVKLPEFVGSSIGTIASALSGIDVKFGDVVNRFGVFGQHANSMDEKLTKLDGKLERIDDAITKLATMPDKIEALPKRFAEALRTDKKE